MEGVLSNAKAWMDNFDEISYYDSKWFPGTDESGKPNGSVMTSGNWTAKSIATGNVVKLVLFTRLYLMQKIKFMRLETILMPQE